MANQDTRTPHNLKIKLKARCPTSQASSCASAESSPIFIASKPLRNDHGSLSPIANRAPQKKNWRSEPNTQTLTDDFAYEDITWAVINSEILEWQNVCLTQRPSWWSPASNWTGGRSRRPGRGGAHAVPFWYKDPDYTHNSGKLYDEERRAVTDSYLADDNRVQDLAHLIAVQLLSACYTLPAECIEGYRSPVHPYFDAHSPYRSDEPRLISSLRMHTEFRYSPSFGHQARNTSPTFRCQGVYDGTSRLRSRGSSSGHNSPNSELSRMTSRKVKFPQFPYMAKRSSDDCSGDSTMELDDLNNSNPSVTTSSWYLSKHDIYQGQKVDLPAASEVNTELCTPRSNEMKAQSSHSSRFTASNLRRNAPDTLKAHKNSHILDPSGYRALYPVIHSEPHNVYIQPVKELVVKRWQTIRRHFGHGFGYVHHEVLSRAEIPIPSASAPPMPLPAEVGPGSPALSSDGKERRRQARESSDFHSDSLESTLLPYAHEFGTDSRLTSLEDPGYMWHQCLPYRKSFGGGKAMVTALVGSGLATGSPLCSTPPNTGVSSRIPSPTGAISESPSSRIDTGAFLDTTVCSPKLSGSGITPPRHRVSYRRHQRSNLSEICTPEEVESEAVMTGFATPVASQKDESCLNSAGEVPIQSSKLETDEKVPDSNRVLSKAVTTISSPVEEAYPNSTWPPERKMRRPSMVRTSTSGTQVFTPSDDGVELDGLPTGPPSEIWDSERQGKKRKQRSFL